MAKILVPETSSQLSLSFEGRLDRNGVRSLPDVSPELYCQAIRKTHERFGEAFKQITFSTVERAIRASGSTEVYLIAKEHRSMILSHLVLDILDTPSHALVALSLNLRGPSDEVHRVYATLLNCLKMPTDVRKDLSAGLGWIVASAPLGSVARIRVGTLQIPPTFESLVLQQELSLLLPQLTALGRPYQVVAA
ncbi:MAG: hypothetical protein QG633_238 [Patescibacteria group bacterium]|jgi:hypothetical protein|nr:hypothetical protein [Patescibacteria group bacterium]